MRTVAIIGGGPAGLRAAEVAAAGGAAVTLFEGERAVGRKLLVAGRSGLNLTQDGEFEALLESYSGGSLKRETFAHSLREFDNAAIREWAAGLGIETFVGSSGKVLPTPVNGKMRSTPLLRRWLDRLRTLGVELRTDHRWLGFGGDPSGTRAGEPGVAGAGEPGVAGAGEQGVAGAGERLVFQCGDERRELTFDRVVLALGGASWPKTGSDGAWTTILAELGIRIAPLEASNCGWELDWPPALLEEAEGLPLKNLAVTSGDRTQSGELMITRYGLEGGPLYRLGPILRAQSEPAIAIDFKPDQTRDQLLARLGNVKRNFVREATRRFKLDPGTRALLKHLPDRGPWTTPESIADEIKHCRLPLLCPRPIAEAISSAGGVGWEELDANLMLLQRPGTFVAGEMIDWDAPTGGYLLQACLATGTAAGRAAATD